jgi:hypothetical protein
VHTDLVVQGLEGDKEGAHRELQHLEKVSARRLRILEDLSGKMKGDVLKQLLQEQSKTKVELQQTKKKLKSARSFKKRRCWLTNGRGWTSFWRR